MSEKRKPFLKSLDPYDWFFILASFIAIGYSLYRAVDMGPDRWGNVSGPLFSLASGFLFVVALRMQLREHRHALEEMEQNNANHADLLLVAKQEKKLNTCLKAVEELSLSIYNRGMNDRNSAVWIHSLGTQWIEYFSPSRFPEKAAVIQAAPEKPGKVFREYADVEALVLRIEWISKALAKDDWDAQDRAYLHVLYEPLRQEVYTQLTHVFKQMRPRFDAAVNHVKDDVEMITWVLGQRSLLESLQTRLNAARVK